MTTFIYLVHRRRQDSQRDVELSVGIWCGRADRPASADVIVPFLTDTKTPIPPRPISKVRILHLSTAFTYTKVLHRTFRFALRLTLTNEPFADKSNTFFAYFRQNILDFVFVL